MKAKLTATFVATVLGALGAVSAQAAGVIVTFHDLTEKPFVTVTTGGFASINSEMPETIGVTLPGFLTAPAATSETLSFVLTEPGNKGYISDVVDFTTLKNSSDLTLTFKSDAETSLPKPTDVFGTAAEIQTGNDIPIPSSISGQLSAALKVEVFSDTAVPEPSSFTLLTVGVLAGLGVRWRCRRPGRSDLTPAPGSGNGDGCAKRGRS